MFRPSVLMTAAGALLLSASGASAARFCIRNQAMTPQCIYDDALSCQREAHKQNGVCTVNEREVKLPRGIGQYCLVLSGGIASCDYGDRETCNVAAGRQGGICAASPRLAPFRAPDPDSPINGR